MKELCFNIPGCTDQLLGALMFLLGCGLVLFSAVMKLLYPFLQDKDGKKVSVLKLEWPQKFTELEKMLDSLSPKAKDIIRWSLKLDFIWMAFLYLLMACLAGWVWRCSGTAKWLLAWSCWLPFITWLFDILENITTLSVLKDPEKTTARAMGTCSLLKWLTAAAYTLFLLYEIAIIIYTHTKP